MSKVHPELKEILLAICSNYTTNVSQIEELLTIGADIETRDYTGNTPLMLACLNNNIKIIEYLVNNGANINKQNYQGFTPILISSKFNDCTAFKYLLTKGVNPVGNNHINIFNLNDRAQIERLCFSILSVYAEENRKLSEFSKIQEARIDKLSDQNNELKNQIDFYSRQGNYIINQNNELRNHLDNLQNQMNELKITSSPHFYDDITLDYHV